MATLNKVTLIGYLGRDPETRSTYHGDAVAHLAVATTESWRDKASGEKRENTEWHRVVLYRKLAEIAGQYLKKGSLVYVEGKLQTRKWTGKDDVERITTEIVADDLRMLGSRPAAESVDDDVDLLGRTPHRAVAIKRASSEHVEAIDDTIPF